MTSPSSSVDSVAARLRLPLPTSTLAGLGIAMLSVLLMGWVTDRMAASRQQTVERITHTMQLLQQLESLSSNLKSAETGQRGFLLTGEERYLAPFSDGVAAIPGQVTELRTLLEGDLPQLERLRQVEALAKQKIDELSQTITRYRSGDVAGAQGVVKSGRGEELMEGIKTVIGEMEAQEQSVLAARQATFERAVAFSNVITTGGSATLLVLIGLAGWVMSRDFRARETQSWIRNGQASLAARVQGEQRLEQLGDNVLTFLAGYLDAQVGAVFIAEPDGRFRRRAGYALGSAPVADEYRPGDSLVGQAAKENRMLHVTDVPAGYLSVGSSLGGSKPAEILIAPASIDGDVQAVVELGFFHRVSAGERALLERASESLGVAVRASKDRSRLEELLGETQRQSEELQTQQEELRVSNEELEEQSRVLRESQGRLEQQQTELEQINSHLEEQTQLLEHQKDTLSKAQAVLTEKAAELGRANQYKSEFLANMSHELRTPLNSSLILAKLLSDNKHGNLTGEQVKFAQTIFAAGNDLLVLINDILDLSKIESGKVELLSESVIVARTIEMLGRSVQPLAQQKQLAFTVDIDPDTPERMQTDPQRLGQIIRNLLSNAFKFTERGSVALRVAPGEHDTITFAVRDTGIGIAPHQLGIIFEAFRQADGSTHRKYGGTGLGLSISRDLARLLGGDITVQSVPGEGSTFTLTLPRHAAQRAIPLHPPTTLRGEPVVMFEPPTRQPVPSVPDVGHEDDDREVLSPNTRHILVVEDDKHFAAILRDLAHELGFQCILTESANAGLAAAVTYRPSAILLDMNLPDHSGLGVLDQLKRDTRTRHIPVHVLSVADYSHQALERGAIGYMLKPVKREQLVDAFRRLEAKMTQQLHRVLVVEDDARQRDSIRALLGNDDVQITAVESGAEALAQLRTATFDCVVMDLTLPDMTGDALLEQMAEQEDVSFPPVIVYTGRSLTRDEEQRLGRFSRSIIIKDARSPERLLDEVTLFLHQVESTLPVERQRMLKAARDRETALEGRRILVVEDDARNIFALSSVLEPKGAKLEIARNGLEALAALERSAGPSGQAIDLVLMDIMMPEMDGLTATREIRRRADWKKLPIIALTAKAMKDDQEKCLSAGANDYIAKPLDVEKLLSLIRVWMPK